MYKIIYRHTRYAIFKTVKHCFMKTRNKISHKLDADDRNKLRSSDFGIPDQREYPMPDAAHVRAAESYFRYSCDEKKPILAHRIILKARKFGVKVESPIILEWAEKFKK